MAPGRERGGGAPGDRSIVSSLVRWPPAHNERRIGEQAPGRAPGSVAVTAWMAAWARSRPPRGRWSSRARSGGPRRPRRPTRDRVRGRDHTNTSRVGTLRVPAAAGPQVAPQRQHRAEAAPPVDQPQPEGRGPGTGAARPGATSRTRRTSMPYRSADGRTTSRACRRRRVVGWPRAPGRAPPGPAGPGRAHLATSWVGSRRALGGDQVAHASGGELSWPSTSSTGRRRRQGCRRPQAPRALACSPSRARGRPGRAAPALSLGQGTPPAQRRQGNPPAGHLLEGQPAQVVGRRRQRVPLAATSPTARPVELDRSRWSGGQQRRPASAGRPRSASSRQPPPPWRGVWTSAPPPIATRLGSPSGAGAGSEGPRASWG